MGLYIFSVQHQGHPIKKQMSSYDNCVSIFSLTAKLHHETFLLAEHLLEGTRGRPCMLSYLSPGTGLLPGRGRGKPSFWNSLSCAEYELFPCGTVYIL